MVFEGCQIIVPAIRGPARWPVDPFPWAPGFTFRNFFDLGFY